jgi:hypothetical protein
MEMNRYELEIIGRQPLLFHQDSIDWSDSMTAWKDNSDNVNSSKAGDDRSPPWRWLGSLYHDNKHVIMPADNFMKSLMGGGAMVPVPGGKGGKTFKAQTMSGIIPGNIGWPLLIDGKPIPIAPFLELANVNDSEKHKQAAIDHGFSLFLKRAKISSSKHVRVRPKFDTWSFLPDLIITDEQITHKVLEDFVRMAGKYKGLGDWRPSSPKSPGSFGIFEGTVKKIAS